MGARANFGLDQVYLISSRELLILCNVFAQYHYVYLYINMLKYRFEFDVQTTYKNA